jgi:hypothetical protein
LEKIKRHIGLKRGLGFNVQSSGDEMSFEKRGVVRASFGFV